MSATQKAAVEAQMTALSVGDQSAATPAPAEKGARKDDIPVGEEGVQQEKQRREKELRMISKPKGTAGRKFVLLWLNKV